MSETKSYPLSDPAVLAAKVKAAGGPAIDPAQAAGTACADGVTLGWSIASGKILITVISKPWIVPYSTIWSHIESVMG